MTIVYRAIKGSPLTIAELDGNFEDLDDRVTALEDAEGATQITNITQVGSIVTVHMSNGDTFEYVTPTNSTYISPEVLDGTVTLPHTLTLSESNKYLRLGHGTLTVPPSDDVSFPVKTEIHLRKTTTATAGSLVIAEGTGVTVIGLEGYQRTLSRLGAVATLKYAGSNVWDLFGFLDEDTETA